MATPNYSVNYDDKRFTEVNADKKAALNEVDITYGNMINNSDKYYQKQINAVEDYGEKQAEIQNQQTDFAIEKIEQQKEQAKQDYLKEQSGAYVDWQKQSGQYGVNAEQTAAQGMANTGFSESSQVSMHNTYQNRVAVARETITRAYLEYDNMMKEARLQNSAALAEIAYNTLLKKNELALAGFQYKNELIIAKSDKKLQVDEIYHDRWQDVLNQINTENALAEEVRQFEKNYDLKMKEYEEGIRQFNEEIARLKAKDAQENALEIQKLELQKASLAEEKRQFNLQYQQQQAKIAKSSGRGASSKNYSKNRSKTTNKSYSGGVKNTKSSSTKNSTYSQAADKMKKAGAISAGDGGLMTKTEWQRRKNSGSKRAETSYATYNDYVNSFTAWRIANPEK